MNPLVMIAASVLPEILKSIAGGGAAGGANDVAAAVVKAVTDIAGTADPDAAKQKIATDPAASDALKIKLAEIAAQQDDSKRAAEMDRLKASLADADAQRKAQLDQLNAQVQAAAQQRADDLQRLTAGLADTQKARETQLEFAKAGGFVGISGPLISVIVTVGFFAVTFVVLFWPTLASLAKDSPSYQIINMVIGALITAFATVVNFWLGSSQGSRDKDAANIHIQARQAQQNADIVKQANDNANAVIRGQPPAPAGGAPTPKSPNFNRCMEIVLKQEGGFVDNPADPGGATNLGITKRTLEAFRGAPVTIDEVRNLTREQAAEIYRANYWNVLHCDSLPAGLDLAVFDCGVNSGPSRAAKMLQQTVGAKDDGAIGPSTLGAIKANNVVELIQLYSQHRLDFLRELPTFGTFGKGWTRRVSDVEKAAMDMAGATAVA